MTDALELTRELIRFDTINPPGNEQVCAEHLGAILEHAGYDLTYHAFGEGRVNLVARKGGNGDRLPICFTGHVDTVPLGSVEWSQDPFAAEISDGMVFGRGSSDMKSGVAAFCVAAERLADALDGTPGVVLVITAGEETGCDGAYDLARKPDALGDAGAIVVAEPTANRPFVGHKGALWLRAATTGKTAHGSMPEKGDNAVYKAARAISQLEDFDFNVARHDVLGAPTLNVGTVEGGININSVPDRAAIGVDIRTIPSQRHAEIRSQLASYLGDDVSIDTVVDVEGVWTDPGDTWIRQVFDVMSPYADEPITVEAAPYFTDASALTPAMGEPPTVILGPGEPSMAHQTDEYCRCDRIEQATDAYEQLIKQWCAL